MDIKKKHFIFIEAGFLTLLVFSFAVIANDYLDYKRAQNIDGKLFEAEIKEDSYLSMISFQDKFNSSSCDFMKDRIFTQFGNLKEVGTDITNYAKLFLDSNQNLSKVKQRDYFLTQFELYAYTLKYNLDCEDDVFPIIYFFNGESSSLDKQSLILEQFALNHKNETAIVSFDYYYDGEIILEVLKEKYNVTYTPFLILNGKTSKNLPKDEEGIVSIDTITIEYLNFKEVD